MTVFEWALPLRDDGRAGEPGRSRLHEPGGRVVIGPAQAEWPRREDRIGYAAGLASGQHRVARLKSILKVLGSGRLRAQRRRGASRPTHLRAAPATGCAVGAAVTESGTRGRFTGRPPCGSRSRRHWSCCRRLRHSRGCGQRRGADALHGGSGSAEARSRHKQRTLNGMPGCAAPPAAPGSAIARTPGHIVRCPGAGSGPGLARTWGGQVPAPAEPLARCGPPTRWSPSRVPSRSLLASRRRPRQRWY